MSIAISPSKTEVKACGDSQAADSLVSGLSFMLVANLLQRGIGFVRNVILCRFLADDQLGLWALASSFFVLAAPLAVLGLPGTFGRMVESYRASGHLKIFLTRVASCSMIGVLMLTSWLIFAPNMSSGIIFGDALSQSTMILIALTLCLVILFNCITELLSGLRRPRVVSAMHTCNSLAFTVASLGGLYLLNDWRVLIVAFALASALGLIPAISTIQNWKLMDASNATELSHSKMWRRVLPFALSIWCMNLLTNLFDVVDRYMLLYLAAETAEHGRALVGQFHSGRIMPVLLSSLTMMLSSILLPYLAAEWEAGRKKQVGESMQLILKCSSLFFVALSVASLAFAPILFQQILNGKYADGLSIMPLAMLHCCVAGIAFLMQTYFWCAERGRIVGVIIATGLGMNIVLNVLLVPVFTLQGAMLATSLAGISILAMTLVEMLRSGVAFRWNSLWFCLLPLTLVLGSAFSAMALALMFWLASRTDWLLTSAEKKTLDQALIPRLRKFGWSRGSLWHYSNP
jgi:polysaccharide transporter, PST family